MVYGEKTLTDLVKGIRASKRDTALYISSCIAEIKSEINSTNPNTKANALQKLTFLQMMGYNMSWASFATIEVMSSPRFAHKRIGYLAATQAFTQDTDVILLTTNTLKKELRGAVGPGMNGVYEAALAINCLSNIVTEDLARELLGDITNLTSHPQPYLRKKAILCLLKMFMKYPQALRLTFPRIQECLLKDTNSSVTSCAVNVITELSDANAKNYLVLAPAFFGLLTSSSNNWMLIKVVKLLGTLVPEEPRLARKLLEPLAGIVKSTQAKSLLYEAVYTITLCLPYCRKADGSMPASVPSIVALSAETLKSFVEEKDQNLKYLGLVGFGSLMISHPKVLSAPGYRPLILQCLSDEDVTIRTRALDLLIGLTTRKNVMDLVTQLLHHVDMASGAYKIDLVEKIVEICSSEKYTLVTDFAWYIDVLVILSRTKGIGGHGNTRNLGPMISHQIMDVTLRVLPVRSYAVRRMIGFILDSGRVNVGSSFGLESNTNIMPEILPVAAFIVGEYSSLIDEALSMENESDEDELSRYNSLSKGTYHALIQAETDPSNIASTEEQTQSVYIQSAIKIFASASNSIECSDLELEACVVTLMKHLQVFVQSMDTEVQERASAAFNLLITMGLNTNSSSQPIIETQTEQIEQTGDLLSLGPTKESNMNKVSIDAPTLAKISSSNLSKATRTRNASETLGYLFVPDHMKPISGKAQKKKITSVSTHVKSILNNDNSLVFDNLFQEAHQSKRNSDMTIESVSFNQQMQSRPVKKREDVHQFQTPTHQVEDPFSMNNDLTNVSNNMNTMSSTISNDASTSLNIKKQDPFYLNSQSKVDNDALERGNRFGAIQLMDSDDSDGVTKKKKRKKKNKKNEKLPSIDLEFLEGVGSSNAAPSMQQGFIDSDDDDEPGLAIGRKDNKSSSSKFNNLAQIDLTTPLRDDEFIPEPKHHVVADRSTANMEESQAKGKKKKKEKKSKSAKKNKDIQNNIVAPSNDVSNNVGSSDLLDFGGMGISAPSQPAIQPQNTISSAFEDLLSLDAPPILPSQTSAPAPIGKMEQTKDHKAIRFWQKAATKSTDARMNDVQVLFKLHSPKSSGVKMSLRVCNNSTAAVSQFSLILPGVDPISISQIQPNDHIDLGKVGPFALESLDLKGKISADGCNAHITMSIPLIMNPVQFEQDQVVSMLDSQEWASSSAKIEAKNQLDLGTVKASFEQFLSAQEVGYSMDNSNYMLASITKEGTVVLFLVKTSKKGFKIDVKSTDKKVAKNLAHVLKTVFI
ncbi:hypothetical protein CTEN210_05836 [Chaetoceros tenuissimus]|uniref:Clathrin/coatomer adaptor adaptin-like N-terminal domain-containing protein n=1 Tax=Chaetoceros tenuissimus TaxID=426638 RepID=A0AAD3CQM5_9STRA|nr:hypothetical protein CTEN210_05836 [Chaetoceros tenuissimus]